MSLPAVVPPAILELAFPVALGACLLLPVVRFLRAPTIFDRLAAVESFSLTFLGLVTVLGLVLETGWFLDFILVYSLIGYVATVAVAKYLARGSIADA